MELRVLQYFLAVARENSISGAAEFLHLSQPTLSRQLKELEEELGKQLFIRGNRRITLTEEGMLLRKRAEEITELMKKAEDEITASDAMLAGDILIGAGGIPGLRAKMARAAKAATDQESTTEENAPATMPEPSQEVTALVKVKPFDVAVLIVPPAIEETAQQAEEILKQAKEGTEVEKTESLEIHYNVTGPRKKELAAAVGNFIVMTPVYMKALAEQDFISA